MPDKVYRTAIYCRLSREDGDKVESNSIASQRAICEDYIARHDDLELVCEPFVDDGYSGVSFNRPQFKKLEEAIRKGALDCIVVKDLSRFSRNYIDGGRYIEKIFPQLGIRFIAINDAYDSLTGDPQSDSFVIPFKNLINDSYCKDISMKIRSSLEVKQKSGEFVGSFAPYGYMKSPENKNQLIVDEAVSEKYAAGSITKEAYIQQKAATDTKIAENDEAIQRSHERMKELDSETACSDEKLDAVCEQYADCKALTYELTHAFISAVYIYDLDNIEIVWKFKDFLTTSKGEAK